MLQNCDSIRDTLAIQKGRYWYPVSTEPIMKSLKVHFDGFTDIIDEEYFITKVMDENSCEFIETTNHWVPCDSEEAIEYAKSLINTTIYRNGKEIKVTKNNYLQYLDELVGKFFINFTDSNQIKDIIDSGDADYFTITYWRGKLPDTDEFGYLKIENTVDDFVLTDPDKYKIKVNKG